jgi:hypothetical protein
MQDIWVSLHSIHSRLTFYHKIHHRPTPDVATSVTTSSTTSSFDVPFKTLLGSSNIGHHRLEASLRSACIQGLPEVGPARLLAAMLGDLGVSTLRLIKTMTPFSSLFGASNQPCWLRQCSRTTLQVRRRRSLVFLVVPTCWETRFSSRRYST